MKLGKRSGQDARGRMAESLKWPRMGIAVGITAVLGVAGVLVFALTRSRPSEYVHDPGGLTAASEMVPAEAKESRSPPEPQLINTGDDFTAIVRSNEAYLDWIYIANPDPKLLDRIITSECECRQGHTETLAVMQDNDLVSAPVQTEVLEVAVIARPHEDLALVKVTTRSDAANLVDLEGDVVETMPAWGPKTSIDTYLRDAESVWRLSRSETLLESTWGTS